ncbi:MAG: Mrp/NBP35 family ATP-binding protein [Clostridiales bacterium]|nr:Mrp/NBP35 family ATP-binding protein [Clostridiales bacterium]
MAEEKNTNVNEECTHDCSTCSQNCSSKGPQFAKLNQYSRVGKVIGVVSGKGGVGKSMVSALLATELSRRDNKVAIMDADITGPSVPKAFGLSGRCEVAPLGGIMPIETKTGMEVMSLNLLVDDETAPVVWRGPIIAGTVQQFWTDVVWGDIDTMVIDCPPGTGDVPLTVFQSIPLDGIIVVTSPQELVSMIVSKAVNMANLMNVPVLGLVENMSYVKCPDCGKEIKVFGESGVDKVAEKFGLPVLAKIPLDPKLTALCDRGLMELFENDYINAVADAVEALPVKEKN